MAAILSAFTDFMALKLPNLEMIALVAYTLSAAIAVRASNKGASLVKGSALCVLSAWGSKILVSAILGEKLAIFDDKELYILLCVLAWLISGVDQVGDALDTLPAKIVLSTLSTLFRTHIALECFAKGAAAAGTPDYYGTAFVTPIVFGVLGALGGGFVPFNKGIGAVDGFLKNWEGKSAIGLAVWMQLATRDPTVKPLIAKVIAPLSQLGDATGLAIAFLVLAPIIVSVVPQANLIGVDAAFKMPSAAAAAPTPAKRRSASPKRK